ncbi:MAG TPA: HPr kinase/phosphatase C-terminal domain-containing protein [Rhizomicrobium sp.]|jgi:serine kinase of HPr protein (carbohydrate metabolism regulator)|nr:HPr kinase/phosphatase C-terminal domain-containing protein [Rhizomicrobium sp.]
MTRTANIHATCVRIGRYGVLLLGPSGAGKSDLALRLIGRGAMLVADDRCDLGVERGRLVARPPKTIAGLLEVRGLGIRKMRYAVSATIALAVDLAGKIERLPDPQYYVVPQPLTLRQPPPLLALCAFEASAPDKVLLALRQSQLVKRI